MLNHKTLSIMLGMLLLIVGSTAFAALPPRISWTPVQLAPASMAPGTSANYTVVLKHTGILPILATSQLRIVAEGAIKPFVTITQPKFPLVFKRGDQVTVPVAISVPANAPAGVKSGNLVLKRILNGKEIEVWRADPLSLVLTIREPYAAVGVVGSTGGTIAVTDPSSPIFGTVINIPPDALDPNEQIKITINSKDELPGAIPPEVVQASKVFQFEKNSSYNFKVPVSITIPLDYPFLGADEMPVVFYWSPHYGKYQPATVTAINRDAKTITFQTKHFSNFVTLLLTTINQNIDLNTGFKSDQDGFLHDNFHGKEKPLTSGMCLGMSTYAQWYYGSYGKAATNQKERLYWKYRFPNDGDLNYIDDADARELISRAGLVPNQTLAKMLQVGSFFADNLTPYDTVLALWTAMKVTGEPQNLMIWPAGGPLNLNLWMHAVTVYRWNAAEQYFEIYDPNHPGEMATLNWSAAFGFSNYLEPGPTQLPSEPTSFQFVARSDFLDESEFEALYQQAEVGWSSLNFSRIELLEPTPDSDGVAVVQDSNQVTIRGAVSGGLTPPTQVAIDLNGLSIGLVPISAQSHEFTFTIPSVRPKSPNILELLATTNPRDTRSMYNGFRQVTLKVQETVPGTPLNTLQFADSNLALCINDTATAQNWQTVEQVTALSCAGRSISNLVSLESFKSLKSLDLTGNAITDLSPLTGLTQLEQLNLIGNTGLRCVELDGLAAALSSTTITRPADCVQQSVNFVWPVTNPIRTQSYSILNGDFNKYHSGFDLISSNGDLTVYAAAAGKVRAIPNGTYITKLSDGTERANNHYMGNVIIIDHNNGQGPFTLYAHLASIDVANGANVEAGKPIGKMGKTGCEDFTEPCGVHLHFEVKQWGVLGNLDDDLGPLWGYTPEYPNLYGYLNPWPYLDHGLAVFSPKVVHSLVNQMVRTGPGAEYTQELGRVTLDQTFVASQQVGDWFEIDFPSEFGPAKGWIQAAPAGNINRWKINDPSRGVIGVSVCPATSTCASSPTRLSYLWDHQRIVELEQSPAQNGCSKPWIKTPLLNGATGWVCSEFLTTETPPPPTLTGKLNDTGITACADATTNGLACPVADYPGQDAQFGRDATNNDDSDGHAGFSFTKLAGNGNPLPASATGWDCVKDNVTGLVWEVKTDDGGLHDKDWTYSWYEPDNGKNGGSAGTQNGGSCTGSACDTYAYVQTINSAGLCGQNDWRMPTRQELFSIVILDRTNPTIDTSYFPNTPSSFFWSSTSAAYDGSGSSAMGFDFYYGNGALTGKSSRTQVRLVRGGQ